MSEDEMRVYVPMAREWFAATQAGDTATAETLIATLTAAGAAPIIEKGRMAGVLFNPQKESSQHRAARAA